MNLPIYELEISEDLNDDIEVNVVSLVKRPAIKKNFLAFNESNPLRFAVQDQEQRIISGPIMLADTPIYRKDKTGEYYVTFSKETISKIVQVFFKKGYQSSVNLMHDGQNFVEGVTMFESWITNKERGIEPMKGFEDAPEGSWFGSFKVDNDQVWERVKIGDFEGFSVEGAFLMNTKKKDQKTKDQEAFEKVMEILAKVDEFYDPNQERDESGRWGSGGGSSKSDPVSAPTQKVDYSNEKILSSNVEKLVKGDDDFDTQKLYTDPKSGEYTKERQEFHKDTIKKYINENGGSTKLGTSYFLGGAPATGKSSILNSGDVVLPKGILVIDSDHLKQKFIPEYDKMVKDGVVKSASKVHEESSMLSKQIVATCAKNGYDIVNDGVGDGSYESVEKKVLEQRQAGKRVVANYVTTSVNTSLQREKLRAEKSGRKVPETYVRNMHSEISKLVPKMAEKKLFDELKLYDNNGSSPKLIFSQIGDKITIHDKQKYDSFLNNK